MLLNSFPETTVTQRNNDTSYFPKTPESFKNPKQDFNRAIAPTTFENWKHTLDLAFTYLDHLSKKHDLPKLRLLLDHNTGLDDKVDKLGQYISSNFKSRGLNDGIGFRGDRYSDLRFNHKLLEDVRPFLDRQEARAMLYLFRIHEVWKGAVSDQTRANIDEAISLFQYVQELKKSKSFSEIKKIVEKSAKKHKSKVEDLYKGKYPLTEYGERKKIITAILQWMTHNPDIAGKCTVLHGREYSPWSRTARIYRNNEMPFVIKEYDIKSSYPQLLDYHFGFKRCNHVYTNLMQAYNIDRDAAKVVFNRMLNTWQAKRWQAEKVYKAAGYAGNEARKISQITADKPASQSGHFSSIIVPKESEIMRRFKKVNFPNQPGQFLHDNYGFEIDFVKEPKHVKKTREEIGANFGVGLTKKAPIKLRLKLETGTPAMTLSNIKGGTFKQVWHPYGLPIEKYNNGNFFFFDRLFKKLNANFDIAAPIFETVKENGKKVSKGRSPGETDFLARIEKLYHILLYLNRDINLTKQLFWKAIDHLLETKGVSFNRNYIEAFIHRLKLKPQDAEKYIIETDLSYRGKPLKNTVFQKLKHQARSEMMQREDNKLLRKEVRKLKVCLHNHGQLKFIDKALFKRSNYTNTHLLVNKIHSLIGIKFNTKIFHFNMCVQRLTTHKGSDNLLGVAKLYTRQKLANEIKVNRRFLNTIISIHENKEQIIQKLDNAIKNLEDHTEPEQLFIKPQKGDEITERINNRIERLEDYTGPEELLSEPRKEPKQAQPVTPESHEYNLSTQKYYLNRWNLESEMVKLSYKSYPHPFLAYVEDNYKKQSG